MAPTVNAQRPIPAPAGLLPELVEVIGRAATSKLIEAFGGTRLYVPRSIGVHHPIAVKLGMRAAAQLADRFGLTSIDLPNPNLRRQRALDAARSGTMTRAQVALAFGYTERGVYKMLAKAGIEMPEDQADERQRRLFG